MPRSQVDKLISEHALARRLDKNISKLSSERSIADLTKEVEADAPFNPIGTDTDGVPYLKTGG